MRKYKMILKTYIADERIESGEPVVFIRRDKIFYVRNFNPEKDSFDKDCCGVTDVSSDKNTPIVIILREVDA